MPLAVVMHGPSQSGKSTFMGHLMEAGQGEAPEVGDGSGESVTQDITLRGTQVGLLVDRPGDNDTMMRFSNEESGRRCAVAVASAGVTEMKFLVFDSMGTDTMQLRATCASLVTTFGPAVMVGVVVVASKSDLSSGQSRERRLAAMRKVMEPHGMTELVTWQSNGLEEAEQAAQLAALRESLGRVRGVSTSDLEDLWHRQRRKAQELCDTQPPRTRKVKVRQEYLEPYDYQESWTEQEPYQTPERTQIVHMQQTRPLGGTYECRHDYDWKGRVHTSEWRGPTDWNGVVGDFHAKKGDIQHFSINRGHAICRMNFQARLFDTKEVVISIGDIWGHSAALAERTVTEMVPTEVIVPATTALRPVTRSRTVVRHRPAARTATQTVEYTLPVEDFYTQALGHIIAEIRATFARAGVPSTAGADVRPEDSVSQVGPVPGLV